MVEVKKMHTQKVVFEDLRRLIVYGVYHLSRRPPPTKSIGENYEPDIGCQHFVPNK